MRFPAFEIFEANDLSIPHPPDMRRAQKRRAILRKRTILNKSPPELEETSPPAVHVYNSSEPNFLEALMSQGIPDKYKDLFQKRAFASLGTLMPDGRPQVTPVWCDFDGEHVIFNSARGR